MNRTVKVGCPDGELRGREEGWRVGNGGPEEDAGRPMPGLGGGERGGAGAGLRRRGRRSSPGEGLVPEQWVAA